MNGEAEAPVTILVADDHSLSRQVLEAILASGGYQTKTASHGKEGWDICQEGSIDLVIADLQMPEMDGFELCRLVKTRAQTRLIPVIIVTAADDIASRIAAFERGADDILPKPVINEELLARVGNLLRFSSLIRKQLQTERSRAALEKELAIAEMRKEEEVLRNRLYHDVLFAATGGRLQLMDRAAMAPLLEDWTEQHDLEIVHPSQIAAARRMAEDVARAAGLDEEGVTDAALCVSEAVTNALKFGTRVYFRGGRYQDQMRFIIEDDGPGLERSLLPQVTLQKGFSTGASMGMGFSIMLEMMDQVGLHTESSGTTVLLAKTVVQKAGDLDADLDAFLERFSVSLD